MSFETQIKHLFAEHLDAIQQAESALPSAIENAAHCIIKSLKDNNKVLICGNGGSAADAQHIASELVNRFECERTALPAIALTTDTSTLTSIANDDAYDRIFARQIEALGTKGDILIAISTSGNSANINKAVESAHNAGLRVVAMTARDGGQLAQLLGKDDVEVRAPTSSTARAQEIHLLCIHCVCALIDSTFSNN